MSLQVLTYASTQNLVALATVKLRLGIDDTSQDALLTDIIKGASDAITGYVGRPFSRQTYLETLSGRSSPYYVGTGYAMGRSTLASEADDRRLHLSCYPVDPDLVTLTIDFGAGATTETDFVVENPAVGTLFRIYGWPQSYYQPRLPGARAGENIAVTYTAGFVLPDQVFTWAGTGLSLALGQWVRPTSPALTPLLFECTTAGAVSGSEPTWPTTTGGGAISLGGASVTPRQARELPARIADLCYLEVLSRYHRRAMMPGLASQSGAGFSQTYSQASANTDICAAVEEGLTRMRDLLVA